MIESAGSAPGLALMAAAGLIAALIHLYVSRTPGEPWFNIPALLLLSFVWILALVVLAQVAVLALVAAPCYLIYRAFRKT